MTSEVPSGRGETWWPGGAADSPGDTRIDVLIPALNEEASLPRVLDDVPRDWVRRIVVVDNGSTDRTAEVARAGGAEVVSEPRKGYGSACLAGLDHMRQDPPDVVTFMDADYSDHPEQLPRVVTPLLRGEAEMVIGSRAIGRRQPEALLPQARFGNVLACALIEWLFGYHYTDLGPFRAIRWQALESLEMRDPDFGWTVEMQARAADRNLPVVEVPVDYRERIGVSKITGTIRGTVLAGTKILSTIAREYVESHR
jgi:glycosyltransferase involved in cell wall biosynthesis